MIYGCTQQTQTTHCSPGRFWSRVGKYSMIAVFISCFSLHANLNQLLCLSQSFSHCHDIITFNISTIIDSTSVTKSIYYKWLCACSCYRFGHSWVACFWAYFKNTVLCLGLLVVGTHRIDHLLLFSVWFIGRALLRLHYMCMPSSNIPRVGLFFFFIFFFRLGCLFLYGKPDNTGFNNMLACLPVLV